MSEGWHGWMAKYGPKNESSPLLRQDSMVSAAKEGQITLSHNGEKIAFYDTGMINDPGAFLMATVKNNKLVIFGAALWHDHYDIQFDKIASADKRHNFKKIGCETNGPGYQSLLALQKLLGSKVEGYNTVNQLSDTTDRECRLVKSESVVQLQRLFNNAQVSFAHTKDLNANKMLDELKKQITSYEITKTPSGQVRLSAPSGLHDDLTICLLGLAKMVSEGVFTHGMVAIRYDGTSTMDDKDKGLGPYAQLKRELGL